MVALWLLLFIRQLQTSVTNKNGRKTQGKSATTELSRKFSSTAQIPRISFQLPHQSTPKTSLKMPKPISHTTLRSFPSSNVLLCHVSKASLPKLHLDNLPQCQTARSAYTPLSAFNKNKNIVGSFSMNISRNTPKMCDSSPRSGFEQKIPINADSSGLKAELFSKIKATQYKLEGTKTFAKCFVSAVNSFEESIIETEARQTFIRIIWLLYKSWSNFAELMKTSHTKYEDTIEGLKEETRQLVKKAEETKEQYEENIKKLNAKYDSRTILQKYTELQKIYKELLLSSKKEKRELEGQVGLLTVTNKELSDKLQSLKESEDRVHVSNKIHTLEEELYRTQTALKKEIEAKSTLGFKLYNLAEVSKTEAQEKNVLIKERAAELERVSGENEKLKEKLAIINSKVKELEGKIATLQEENRELLLKNEEVKEVVKAKEDAIKNGKKRLEELEMQLKLEKEGLITHGDVIIEETLENLVNNKSFAGVNSKRRHSSIAEMEDQAVDYDSNTGEYGLSSLNPLKWTFAKPSYQALISELLPSQIAKVPYTPFFPLWLNATIRAIFDSYYSGTLLSFNKGMNLPAFPEFVYAWLGTYTVDSTTYKVRDLQYTEKDTVPSSARLNLFLGLELTITQKQWEIQTFKEFLEESVGVDELIFFLHTRAVLFHGLQLNYPPAVSCVVHFVSKDKVFRMIDRVLSHFPADRKETLKAKLVEYTKATCKDENAFDSAMVLRVLLEFYKKQKKENIVKFTEIYKSVKFRKVAPSSKVTFQEFREMVQGIFDPEITPLELVKLYRDAYVTGGSGVTLDSILTTFSESYTRLALTFHSNFWIRYLRLRGQNLEPKYDARGEFDPSSERSKECAHTYKFFFIINLIDIGKLMRSSLTRSDEPYKRWAPQKHQYSLTNQKGTQGGKGKKTWQNSTAGPCCVFTQIVLMVNIELYRRLWAIIMEILSVHEELSDANEGRHIMEEFAVYQKVVELFQKKIRFVEKREEKKERQSLLSQTLIKSPEGMEVVNILKSKIIGEASPQNKQSIVNSLI
eukprot:TRINITY_DN862_c0_g1_i1.p1 TRINITY_DN862_c0_g1~~TRINITY_DN862_c0_g1_i1.p1  ORF type:complete len:1032 (-),score=96.55 TRINITY_DN862_c0_g1_i1:76-3171(-)